MALHVVPLKMDNKSLEDYVSQVIPTELCVPNKVFFFVQKIIFKKLEGNLKCQFELAEVKLTTEDHAQLLSANVNGQVLFIPATSKDGKSMQLHTHSDVTCSLRCATPIYFCDIYTQDGQPQSMHFYQQSHWPNVCH